MRVCLVSSIHPWVNPRLVKEADTLTSLGHEVTVVTKRVDAWSDGRDELLLKSKPWSCRTVDLLRGTPAGKARWFCAACWSRLALRAYGWRANLRWAEEAYYRGFSDVLRLAVGAKADFYIAHTQGALPIAARAAEFCGVQFSFDCEDLLAEEAADGLTDPKRRRAILDIERAYIPKAAYVTATSRAMAEHLAASYRIPLPRIVHNVFWRAELDGVPSPDCRERGALVELLWISATVGPGRGLEDALIALAHLPHEARLTIIGRMLPSYTAEFAQMLGDLRLAQRVSLRPVVSTRDLLPTLARYDIGLSLDPNNCLNRSLTISNKLFQYLQAGLLVAASDTPGQREIMEAVGPAGFLYVAGKGELLAERLRPYITDRARLLEAQQAAWEAGRVRYNWDVEQFEFLDAFEAVASPAVPRGEGGINAASCTKFL